MYAYAFHSKVHSTQCTLLNENWNMYTFKAYFELLNAHFTIHTAEGKLQCTEHNAH